MTRRHASFIAVVTLVVPWLAACRETADAATPHRGVQLHSLWGNRSPADMYAELDLARRAGSNVVRVDVGWSSLEQTGKGRFSSWYLARLDRFVAGASSRGMKVIAALWSTPCWASRAPPTLKRGCAGSWWDRGVTRYPPTNPGDYAAVTRWMTARYGGRLAAVEVWNEPSLNRPGRFWNSQDPAGDYAALLKAAYPAAKAGDPAVAVLAGSLSGPDRAWLSALYARGIKGSFDGLAVHPYGESEFAGLDSIRSLQLSRGDTKPVWVTEFGWATGAEAWGVSDREQAANILRGFAQLGQRSWVRAAVLYELRDQGPNRSYFEHNWGVVRRDFTPKPAYAALSSALR